MAVVPFTGIPGTPNERTLIAVKPDGVQRGKVGEIVQRFEQRGYKLLAIKMLTPTQEQIESHYAHLASSPWFLNIVNYFVGAGPIVAMVWEGRNSIRGGRSLIGATKPADSLPGTVRCDFCIDVGRNLIHGSDGAESAQKEIALWFTETEVTVYTRALESWIHE